MHFHPSIRGLLVPIGLLLAIVASPVAASAQRADSAQAAVHARPRIADTVSGLAPRPPISPRRAFLYSLLIPGYSQSRLGRPTAGLLFALSESIGIAMLRESIAEVRQAERFRTDSLLFLGNDPVTGQPIMQRAPYDAGLVEIRRGHREDWIAFLIANHLFAAADGYVAANLWDLPSQVTVRASPGSTVIAARIRW
ncbi:MAG: hypothetical protein H0W68_04380 [Gemmatimonadaceae bacterium]|nr:hypothetical protein [Gemmatimonadaceae bacterium]